MVSNDLAATKLDAVGSANLTQDPDNERHAAAIQKPSERARIAIVEADKQTVSNMLSVTKKENAGNMLAMQYSRSRGRWRTLADVLPDLSDEPSNEGTIAFYDLDNVLAKVNAEKVIVEVKTSCPRICPLDADIILDVHTTLAKGDLGGDLPYHNIGYFLDVCHDRVKAGYSTDTAVREALRATKRSNKHLGFRPIWTAPKEEGENPDLVSLISCIRHFLNEITEYILDQSVDFREQHVGIQRHASIEDLMNKHANVVDKTAFKVLSEQIHAIHMEQVLQMNKRVADAIGKLNKLIDQAFVHILGSENE